MLDEATETGAESTAIETETAPDPDETLINALTATDDDETGEPGEESEATADLFTVKINGEEKQVSRDELIAHYQKEQAASQKFEEAAQIRREVEQQREQYLQGLQQSQQFIDMVSQQAQQWAMEGQPNWQELLENNPHEYLKQQEIFKQRQATLQAAQQQHAYLQQQQAHEHEQQVKQHLNNESERLLKDLIPEWKNEVVREREKGELLSHMLESGYSENDIKLITNSQFSKAEFIRTARKAMLYDRAMAKANSLKKQTPTAANPVPTVGNKAGAQGKKSIFDPNLSDTEYDRMRREQRRKAG
jgi:hypothetical protein